MTGSSALQTFRAIDVIRKKRDGIELSQAEIEGLVNSYTAGEIPDYQVSAWLMAVVLATAVAVTLGLVVTDVAYGALDPRVREELVRRQGGRAA